MDEMDQDDLISDVYNKGETLLQSVTGPVKSKLETQLGEFEQEWADFCKDVSSFSSTIKETKDAVAKVEKTTEDLVIWLKEAKDTLMVNTQSGDVVMARKQMKVFEVSIPFLADDWVMSRFCFLQDCRVDSRI